MPEYNVISEPSDDEKQKLIYRNKVKTSNKIDLDVDTKYIVLGLQLAVAVTPEDFPVLKDAILAIQGIQEIKLLLSGQTPASIPADTKLELLVSGNLTINDDPPPSPPEDPEPPE